MLELGKGEQNTSPFPRIDQNGRVAAIVDYDADDVAAFQSGAEVRWVRSSGFPISLLV